MRIMVAQRMSNRKIMMFLFIRYVLNSFKQLDNENVHGMISYLNILVDGISGLGLKEMGQYEYMSKIVPFL